MPVFKQLPVPNDTRLKRLWFLEETFEQSFRMYWSIRNYLKFKDGDQERGHELSAQCKCFRLQLYKPVCATDGLCHSVVESVVSCIYVVNKSFRNRRYNAFCVF